MHARRAGGSTVAAILAAVLVLGVVAGTACSRKKDLTSAQQSEAAQMKARQGH